MREDFKEKLDSISAKIDLCNKSITWWEGAIIDILDELDLIRLKPSSEKLDERDAALVSKLIKLIPRGDLELQIVNKLEKEFKELIRNEGKQIKTKTKKKSPPKRKDI